MCLVPVFLRSSTKQLGTPRRIGQGCAFHSCTTNNYKLHFLETPSGLKLVLNTRRDAGDLRSLLSSMYDELLVERVFKNPAYVPGQPIQRPQEFAMIVTAWLKQRSMLQ